MRTTAGSGALPGERSDPPAHLRPALLALVAIGGTVGTAAREGLTLVVPTDGVLPVAVFGINVVGAFLLGLLLDALARRGPDEGRRRLARLLLGTGFCGGFTTYSALAVGTALLLSTGAVAAAALSALATVVVGGAASWAGIACGAAVGRRS